MLEDHSNGGDVGSGLGGCHGAHVHNAPPLVTGQQTRQVGWALCCAPLLRFGRRRQEAAHTHVVAKFSATSSDGFWYHDYKGLAPAGVL